MRAVILGWWYRGQHLLGFHHGLAGRFARERSLAKPLLQFLVDAYKRRIQYLLDSSSSATNTYRLSLIQSVLLLFQKGLELTPLRTVVDADSASAASMMYVHGRLTPGHG